MSPHLRKPFFLLCILFIGGCSPREYKAVPALQSVDGPALPKPIVIKSEYMVNREAMIKTLNTSNWMKMDQTIGAIQDLKLRNFLRSIRLMMAKDYYTAYYTLTALKDTDYDCQVRILKADCLQELKADSVDLRKKYQDALDCTSDVQIKHIILTRFRLAKYEQL